MFALLHLGFMVIHPVFQGKPVEMIVASIAETDFVVTTVDLFLDESHLRSDGFGDDVVAL